MHWFLIHVDHNIPYVMCVLRYSCYKQHIRMSCRPSRIDYHLDDVMYLTIAI